MTNTLIQPLVYSQALTASSVTVLSANPSRSGLLFHNPNSVSSIWVAPQGTTAAQNGAGSFQVFPGGDRVFSGDLAATCGWNAAMDAGATGNISILEWN
jgi:hypothetical protein